MLVSIALFLLALLHLAWALGSTWPERTPERLSALVVGTRGPMPSPFSCLFVALLLSMAACFLLGATGHLVLPLPLGFVRFVAWCVVCVFTLRGIGGFFDVHLRPSIRELPYHRWNRLFYSPLCLILAALGAWSLV